MDEDREESEGGNRAQSPSSTTDDAGTSNSSQIKPRIWSLADLAASPSQSSEPNLSIGGKIPYHRPLHSESSPYGRPLTNPRVMSAQEALLQAYARSLGFPLPHQPHQPTLQPTGFFPSSLPPIPTSLPTTSSQSPIISRPLPTRSFLPTSIPHRVESPIHNSSPRLVIPPSSSSK